MSTQAAAPSTSSSSSASSSSSSSTSLERARWTSTRGSTHEVEHVLWSTKKMRPVRSSKRCSQPGGSSGGVLSSSGCASMSCRSSSAWEKHERTKPLPRRSSAASLAVSGASTIRVEVFTANMTALRSAQKKRSEGGWRRGDGGKAGRAKPTEYRAGRARARGGCARRRRAQETPRTPTQTSHSSFASRVTRSSFLTSRQTDRQTDRQTALSVYPERG